MKYAPFTAVAIALCAVLVASPGIAGDAAIAAPPGPSETQLISVSNTTPPVVGDRNSGSPSVSADGRFVAFESLSQNLSSVPGEANTRQIYVRDTQTGSTQMISATPTGRAGDLNSADPSISADGNWVAFRSGAMNLVPGRTSGSEQALLWSRDTGTIEVVSLSNDAIPVQANSGVQDVVLSADGRTVAFSTTATNLTKHATGGYVQVFARDRSDGTTSLISVNTTVSPEVGAMTGASSPSISADGSKIAFVAGTPLTSTPTDGSQQVYLHDRVTDSTSLVSVSPTGQSGVAGSSDSPSISADGRLVAFSSAAQNMSSPPLATRQIYVRHMAEGTTTLESISFSGAPFDQAAKGPSLSSDGNVIAFVSTTQNGVPDGASFPLVAQVYVRNMATGSILAASRPITGVGAGDEDSSNVSLSPDGTFVTWESHSANMGPVNSGFSQVYLRNVGAMPSQIVRVGGADRYDVSSANSASAFPVGTKDVFIASGAAFPDALSGSARAGVHHSPVLLVSKDAIPASVAAELTRLAPTRIHILGGEASVSPEVANELANFADYIVRVSGADRFEVSAEISRLSFAADAPVAYVASGAVFPDALSGGAVAGAQRGPVLLVTRDSVPAVVKAELARLAPRKIVVLGGVDTIADTVVAGLQGVAPTTRIAGADRFAVSAAVSASVFQANTNTVYVASGAVFPDALSGSAAAIQNKGPVLLVTRDSITAPIAAELRRLNPKRIVVLGGVNTISDATFNALRGYLAP